VVREKEFLSSGRIVVIIAGGILLASAVLLGLRELHAMHGRARTDDAFIEGDMVLIASRVSGSVVEVAVEEHQAVRAGDLLVRLDPADYEVGVTRAQAAVAAAENDMRASEAAAASAEAEGKAAESELWRAGREADRVASLFERKATSRHDLDQAMSDRDAAEARVHAFQLRAVAERAVLGNQAPVRLAEAALHEAELALEYTRITAPFDGVVGRKNVEPGAIVAPGQPLLSLTSTKQPWVIANFKETQIRDFKVGAPAEIRVDAYPGVVWQGHVESFSPATGSMFALLPPEPASGNFTKVVQRVPVKIVLDEGPGLANTAADSANEQTAPHLYLGLAVEATVFVR